MVFVLKTQKSVSAEKTHIPSLTTKTNESVRDKVAWSAKFLLETATSAVFSSLEVLKDT